MMEIRHHLDDRLLMAYSAGALPEAFNLVVATHVSMCDDCRALLGEFDAVGGAVLEDCGASAMPAGSLEATMRLIAVQAPQEKPSAARRARGIFPGPLQDYVGGDLAAVRWRSIGMGVKQAILPTSKDATVRLLHIPGGVAIPDHGHRGIELTLVLQGAFRDETDRFGPGDIEIADQTMEHTPVAEPGPACICLAATDAKLRFNALLPRIAQPFFRI